MEDSFKIVNTDPNDLPVIYKLFDDSILYQEKNGYISWRGYDQQAIIRDIQNGDQYKIVVGNQVAIVFSVCYTDKIIWRTMDKNDSIYLHRIVVNPAFKGQQLFGRILDWAIGQAKSKGLQFVRMDTWAENKNIIDYYKKFGFVFIENYTTPDTVELPAHNRKLSLALLEYKL